VVEHGVPRGVAVDALDQHVLLEDALEGEPEAFGRPAARFVEGVALPLQAAVAELVEDVARSEEERLAGDPGASDLRVPQDVAEFDDAVVGCHAHQRLAAVAAAAGRVDDGEEQGIVRGGRFCQPRGELGLGRYWLSEVAEA